MAVVVIVNSLSGAAARGQDDPLVDYADWKRYRTTVAHPTLAIKSADLRRAKENAQRYPWAKNYVAGVIRSGEGLLKRIDADPAFVESMIPTTTPGDPLFTPCPACRDLQKPVHPHGQWDWSIERPDELKCQVCATVFPNAKYPETIRLDAKSGRDKAPQTFTFHGGEPFVVFEYKQGRPSTSGAIRARKVAAMGSYARQLAEAYALSGRVDFARATRAILLRLAAVYPNYLVHVGYGEYADIDPRIASFRITDLPDGAELCYPPNKPDAKLHTGYWSAGRASGVGGEGRQLQRWVEAYDFTCEATDARGKPVYSGAERMTIERDLLLEGTVLLVADKGINNKSVQNRSAVAMVGMGLGHPGLVRFGLEGLHKAVNDWFLPDGQTPESPAYAHMTLWGVKDAAQVYRGYTDPPGYRDGSGKRIERYDPYHDPSFNYAAVWRAQVETMQGDLHYPPFADSYLKTSMPAEFAELMVANYPDRPEYLSLLAELAGPKLDKGLQASSAIYYREPGLEARVATAPKLTLPDLCSPELRIGFMRTGEAGRESLLTLSASHWGSHHHADSLNLYYWKSGNELLSDLGYLWDHPDKKYLARTFAHNTVLIDEANQETTQRGGTVEFFATDPHVKAMRASSKAYPNASLYQRTSAIIDHGGDGASYVVDFFFVEGGKTQDYVYHGPNNAMDVELVELTASSEPLYDLKEIRASSADPGRVWSGTWKFDDGTRFVAWNLPQPGETVAVGSGWGQRDYKNSDQGATLPYIVRRTRGEGVKVFTSIFEGEGYAADDRRVVRAVERLPISTDRFADVAALRVETLRGHDVIVCSRSGDAIEIQTPTGPVRAAGRLSVISKGTKGGGWSFAKE
jgi:hypothetical protein